MTAFRAFDFERDFAALRDFSRRMYGPRAYQASERYYRWLYREHPAADSSQGCLLVVEGDSIVGCLHRMPLPARDSRGNFTLVSLQNHIVEERLRGGIGILLLRRAVSGEAAVFSPGVSGRLSEAYRRLGYRKIDGYWLGRWISRAGGIAQYLRVRTGFAQESRIVVNLLRSRSPLSIDVDPDARSISELTARMNEPGGDGGPINVLWTPALVKWRYFSSSGPRHILIRKPASGAIAVVSIGIRHGLSVARLLELVDCGDRSFVDEIALVARTAGAVLMLAFTLSVRFRDALVASGFRERGSDVMSFLMGTRAEEGISASAAATDIGFEAMLTEVR